MGFKSGMQDWKKIYKSINVTEREKNHIYFKIYINIIQCNLITIYNKTLSKQVTKDNIFYMIEF